MRSPAVVRFLLLKTIVIIQCTENKGTTNLFVLFILLLISWDEHSLEAQVTHIAMNIWTRLDKSTLTLNGIRTKFNVGSDCCCSVKRVIRLLNANTSCTAVAAWTY